MKRERGNPHRFPPHPPFLAIYGGCGQQNLWAITKTKPQPVGWGFVFGKTSRGSNRARAKREKRAGGTFWCPRACRGAERRERASSPTRLCPRCASRPAATFVAAKRGAALKAACCICHRQRFSGFCPRRVSQCPRPFGAVIGTHPKNRFALSATGGASVISPLPITNRRSFQKE